MREATKEVVYENDDVIMFEVCETVPIIEGKIQPSFQNIVGTITEISSTLDGRNIKYIFKQSKTSPKVLIEPLRVPSGIIVTGEVSKINEIISTINEKLR